MQEGRIRGGATVRVYCVQRRAAPRPKRPKCVCLERRVQLAGATPRLAAPLGIVESDEVPVQDCGVVRVLDLRAYGTYLGCNQPL